MADEMAALRAAKKELRTMMRQQLSQLSTNSIQQQSRAAVEILLALPEYKNAQQIGVYLSMPKGELSTKGIVHDAFREGKKVFVPYIHSSKSNCSDKPRSVMSMVSLHSLSDYESLGPDAWGIPSVSESSAGERQQILNSQSEGFSDSNTDGSTGGKRREKLDVIVMPGVAFDKDLRRLGHGKGFYDNFLNRYHSPMVDSKSFLVGLCLDVQLLPDGHSVPTDASDHNLDALVVGDGTVVRPEGDVS